MIYRVLAYLLSLPLDLATLARRDAREQGHCQLKPSQKIVVQHIPHFGYVFSL
jgi:hypothetical protein